MWLTGTQSCVTLSLCLGQRTPLKFVGFFELPGGHAPITLHEDCMASAQPNGAITVTIACLTADPETGLPSVILRDRRTGGSLAIPVGLSEASAIATELNSIELERPTTHQLMAGLLEQAGAKIFSVEVCDYSDGTFFAAIHFIRCDGVKVQQDARPSDALVLALRADVEIRVTKTLLDKVTHSDLTDLTDLRQCLPNVPEDLPDVLEGLSDDAFGEWKM